MMKTRARLDHSYLFSQTIRSVCMLRSAVMTDSGPFKKGEQEQRDEGRHYGVRE